MLGGVEAGGTKVVVAVAEDPEAVVERVTIPTGSPREVLASVRAFLDRFPVNALGIATFGPVELDASSAAYGEILDSPKRDWVGVNWITGLGWSAADAVAVETDVGAAALAERCFGAGLGVDDLAYVTVGTGVGVGVVANGDLVHGALHPEAGHLRVRRLPADPFEGSCPFHGDCVEGLASATAIRARTGREPAELSDDDPCWDAVEHALGELVSSIAMMLSSRRVVLGGGVLRRPRVLSGVRRRAETALRRYLTRPPFDDVHTFVQPAALGQDAGLIGALRLAELLS